MLIRDLVGNAAPDVLITAYADNALVVFNNSGNNQYDESVLVDFGPGADGPTQLRVADVNQDGARDIVTNSVDLDAVIPLLYTGGQPPYEGGAESPGESRSGFALADLDHDCAPDMVKTVKSFNAATLELWLNANDASGKFDPAELDIDYPSQDVVSMEFGDFDGDGNPDLVIASSSEMWAYYMEP